MIDSEHTYLDSKTSILIDAGYDVDVSYQYKFMGTTYDYMWSIMKDELKLLLDISAYINDTNQCRAGKMYRF